MVNLLDLSDLVTAAAFLASAYFTYIMAQETKWDKHFVLFFVSAVLLGVNAFTSLENTHVLIQNRFPDLALLNLRVGQFGLVFGALALAYASRGIRNQMREVRESLSGIEERPKAKSKKR